MDQMNLSSKGSFWRRLFATNVAAAAAAFDSGGVVGKVAKSPFVADANFAIISLDRIPTAEQPSFDPDGQQPNSIELRFFGENASNDSFSARIWGLTRGSSLVGSTATESWEATLLAELLITLGNIQGVDGTLIENASFEADTIVKTYGASEDIVICSPANDLRGAWARIDHRSFPMIGIEFDDAVNSGTPADACNCLYRWVW